jgi:CRP-like cAMP-binding protein
MNDNFLEVSGATLTGIDVFSDLNAKERNEVAKQCRGHRFDSNQLIVSHLDNTNEVFFIISGTVRVTIYSKAGKETTFRDVSAGQMFGELSAIDNKPRSAHVIALAPSSVLFVSANKFWELLEKYPSIAKRTLQYLTKLVRLLSDRVVEINTLGVKNRIHAELLRLARNQEKSDEIVTITPVPTHADLANRIGTHREAVTRELGVLARQGIVLKKANKIIIHDMERLQRMVDDVLNDKL